MIKAIFRLIIVSLLLSACTFLASTPEPTPTLENTATAVPTFTPIPPTKTPIPTATATEIPLPASYGPDNFPADVNPLTGLITSDPVKLDRLPISVKIQIFPRSDRPPFGIAFADIVYDYYQNSGLTRFNAIFYGNDSEQVGPIRSGRLLDAAITRMYKSVLVFGGADKRIVTKLFNSEFSDRLIVEGTSNCPPMCRFDPNGYNYLVLNTKEVGQYLVNKGVVNARQDLNGMSFAYLPPSNGSLASQVYIRYSISAYARWDYDPATGRYLRFQDTSEAMDASTESYEPLTDRLTGQQIVADNVVILVVKHEYLYKSGASEIIDINLNGSGKAYAFRDGQVYEVQWSRPMNTSVLSLINPDGSPFPFKQGVTWFQPIGVSSIVTVKEGGVWRFEMRLP